ncbi:phosphoribosyltransferase domain-containing protein [Marinagarivorans algicola]|uniref:phosphoribosyltransferase domain-containing protein n=1 Tax=Marinagarivorans algicola TaxID=1513270 RepID=UPI003736E175
MHNQNQCGVTLQTGRLEVEVEPSTHSIENLLEFASRENPKRAYLFVSKVLGKYIPCKPSTMRNSYRELAKLIHPKTPTLVLGIAETATGLGAGVAQSFCQQHKDIYFSQTTRFKKDRPLAFDITEKHSHAPQHLIYDFNKNIPSDTIRDVVLVDDEISTGNTLTQITQEVIAYLPNVERVHWLSLVNWMSHLRCKEIKTQHSNIDLHFASLLKGEFNFKKTSNQVIEFPRATATELSRAHCRWDLGRTGVCINETSKVTFINTQKERLTLAHLDSSSSYVVVGTGEFNYQPFLFAEIMEQAGFDVLFESTGRSPILKGGGISSKLSFFDACHQANYYLYNLPEERTPIILYETLEQLEGSPLHKLLNCRAYYLEDF